MSKLKFLLSIAFVLCILHIPFAQSFEDDEMNLRDYSGIELAKGTFLNVITVREISTLYSDLGTKMEFIATSNLYLNEVNIIPKGSRYYGYVDLIHEPIVGTDASMRIKIVKLVLPDGYELPMQGYIYSSNGFLIGGGKTQPASYIMKRSRMQGFPSMVGYVPGPELKMGEHVTIASGTGLIVCLTAPLYITHTVTN